MFRQIVPSILRHAPDAVLLVVTNPVDVMTHLAAHFAAEFGVPPTRVIGSGTTLDTARLRALLGRPFRRRSATRACLRDRRAWRLGSAGLVASHHRRACRWTNSPKFTANRSPKTIGEGIDENVRRAAYQIIAGKGATFYGIGSAVARIVDVLLHDQRAILTICSRITGVPDCDGVTLALPHLVGGDGALATIPLSLDETEREGLRRSASILREAIQSLDLK